jgi:hypothetical protein
MSKNETVLIIKQENTENKAEVKKVMKNFLTVFNDFASKGRKSKVCPECSKQPGLPQYFSSIGNLKEHLIHHYRMKYYYDYVYGKSNDKSKKPWCLEYNEVPKSKLIKYMDNDIFKDFIEMTQAAKELKKEKERRDEEAFKRNKEQKYLVDKQRDQRIEDFHKRISQNKAVFNSSTDTDTEKERIKERKKLKREKRKIENKTINSDSTLHFSDSEVDEKKDRKRSRDEKKEKKLKEKNETNNNRRKPVKLQQHNLCFSDFEKEFKPTPLILCPLCDSEFEKSETFKHFEECRENQWVGIIK